ncbi:hypothetical protein ALC57_11507, partial [Trachymyrmex cornetzi]
SFELSDLARGPAGLSFRPARDLTHEDIWGLVSSLAQSAGGIDIAENFTVRVFRVALPTGRGRQFNRLTHEDVAKRSILQIINSDNLCFPRSLVAARVHYDRGHRVGELHERWESVRHQRSSLQRELAKELTISAGITIPEEGCGIREIEQFQRFLATENIAIIVYNFSTFGRGKNPLYDGCALFSSLGREPSFRLNIMYYERSRHYQPILNMKAAAGSRGGYCVASNIGYRNGRGHRCARKCPRCYAIPSCKGSGAELVRICNDCGRFVKSNSRHDCDVIFCKICRSLQTSNNSCYIQPLGRKVAVEDSGEGTSAGTMREENQVNDENDVESANDARSKKDRVAFVFYDFETRQDETLEGTENVKIHIPTLCVAQQICETCAENKKCRSDVVGAGYVNLFFAMIR